MDARGYMNEAEFDGQSLTARGTNRVAHTALVGKGAIPGDLVLAVTRISDVTLRDAGVATNGALVVTDVAGRPYELHFRRKQEPAFRELHAELERALLNAHGAGAEGAPVAAGVTAGVARPPTLAAQRAPRGAGVFDRVRGVQLMLELVGQTVTLIVIIGAIVLLLAGAAFIVGALVA